jgi:hypothetical protein
MQSYPAEMGASVFATFFAALFTMMLIGIAINVFICYLVFTLYKAVPAQFRQMDPGLVWLMLIPLFNLVWNFFVFPKLSESYERALQAQGNSSAGNCNAGLALALPITWACVLVPCIGMVAGLAALVILIIYLVKMFDLKTRLASGPAA